MSRIGQPSQDFSGDLGEPDEVVRRALAQARDQYSYARAIVALCTARLLLPLAGDESGEMAAVSLETDDGSRALLAFTGLDALEVWHSLARPVPCTLDDLAATVGEADADCLLLDVAGPAPLVIEGEWLEHLARGERLVEFEDQSFGWIRLAKD